MARLNIRQHAPQGFQAVADLDRYARENLDDILFDLVKLRASQLNGCAYCVDMHATDLEKLGQPTRRIYAVSAWRDTGFFTERERAALALTEAITMIATGVDDAVWAEAARLFPARELSDLVLAIGTINVWNRICVSTLTAPPPLVG
ncbi:carboxymuconolactone decarboxylase family protein [Polymorphospora sp. NPDC050346]|uniref:carboxymuconolactone decarboxylase family protein n=1 Tax=Polymorphospora sp. NPDC050346 TaxID=3155780 RepID=UPI00340D5625